MSHKKFLPDEISYFSYDRNLTTDAIRSLLKRPGSREWLDVAAWIMREAAFRDVWFFLSPAEVGRYLSLLEPHLGKQRAFWRYIIGAWRELGKIQSPDAA